MCINTLCACMVRVCSFKTSKNDHVIEVQLHDDLDFICPYYPPTESSTTSTPEYYTIYMVCIMHVYLKRSCFPAVRMSISFTHIYMRAHTVSINQSINRFIEKW